MHHSLLLRFLPILLVVVSAVAQEPAPVIRVAAVQGAVRATLADGGMVSAKPQTVLTAGVTVMTGPNSAADIFFGNEVGTVRLTEKSKLTITEFLVSATGGVMDLQLHLEEGTLLGMGSQVPKTSRYQIKTNQGIADVQAKNFRLNAQGLLVVLEGRVAFAHIGNDNAIQLHDVHAPPPYYFWPGTGVNPAPPALVKEVTTQASARLR